MTAAASSDTLRGAVATHPAVGTLHFDDALPISAARDDIAAAIEGHQVVIVAGETGSGKTTQLPKILMALGRGSPTQRIGHTQPRRLAARAVAERIAAETGTELGSAIGYAVRFTDKVADDTVVKVMTDGILLAELGRDKDLRAYDTIIIDEAHERSLNIDFLLGYLKQLLPRRPDLKVIITSATIDPERFAAHFATAAGPVPIIEVSGRTYPVEIRYRPYGADSDSDHADLDQAQALRSAVSELMAAGPGDILVFLPTERDIRDTERALSSLTTGTHPVEIVPLFARLSAADQHKVFAPHRGRRLVLATNVAETSLTVPGIRYVIDTGTARISRYSTRTKMQRLPIEPISQASARQRAGRCGRVADGICIRLYSEDDYESRPAHTDPEILRTNLAAVILQMLSLRLGAIEAFPFVQPPDAKQIRDGMALLTELGALSQHRLTRIGTQLARLPLDPRLGRMLLAGRDTGSLAELLIIVSALALPDVRERPADAREAADQSHRRFDVPGSEFLSYVQLWNYLEETRTSVSGNQFRRTCEREYLHWLRIREWRDLHRQLRQVTRDLGWQPNTTPATADQVHQALLTGLLSHIGLRDGDTREFIGPRNTRFVIFPGSPLAKKPPRLVMAAEIVETARLFARTVAGIDPAWVETAAGDLVKRSYSEPHWSTKQQAVLGYESVTLFGVPLITRRRINYGRIDAPAARELFIRHALIAGEWTTHHPFFAANQALLDTTEDLEDRARRRDLLVTEDELFAFYDARVGPDVVSTKHFDTWWKKARRDNPELLTLTAATATTGAATINLADYPDTWRQGEMEFALRYSFEPGTDADGVSVEIPLELLDRVRPSGFDWLVPGFRTELVTALIRGLPKRLRTAVVPAPDFADCALAALRPRSEPLVQGLARELSGLAGIPIAAADFDVEGLPAHLRMRFVAVGADGAVAGADRSLAALRGRLRTAVGANQRARTRALTKPPAWTWTAETLGTIAPEVTQTVAGQSVTSYPAPTLAPQGVAVAVYAHPADQRAAMTTALRELLVHTMTTASPRHYLATLTPQQRLALSQSPYAAADDVVLDCHRAAAAEVVGEAIAVWNPQQFAALAAQAHPVIRERAAAIFALTAATLVPLTQARDAVARCGDAAAVADVREQLGELIFPGFVALTPAAALADLPRYLRAITVRLGALPGAAARDQAAMATIDRVVEVWANQVSQAPERRRDAINEAAQWLVEELRVGLFAQQLGTPFPVSEQRITKKILALS